MAPSSTENYTNSIVIQTLKFNSILPIVYVTNEIALDDTA